MLSVTGRVLYVSHTVAPLLGHLQNNLIGRSLFELVHESDRGILENTLKTHFNSEVCFFLEISEEIHSFIPRLTSR